MRPLGANYTRLRSIWEPRFHIGHQRFIFAGYWTHGVPNRQPQEVAVDGSEWGHHRVSKIEVTEG